MSFVIAATDLVQGAAQDLAGIGSSLAEATAAVAGPTTGVVAAGQDGVSLAVASMFGGFGQEFQAVSSQVQAFHDQFVGAMDAGGAAYAGTEVANVSQTLLGGGVGQLAAQIGQVGAQAVSQPMTGLQAGLAASQAGVPSALTNALSAFGVTLAGPYQTLAANTATSLQTVGGAMSADPGPFSQQVAANEVGHAQTFAAGLGSAVQSLPAQLANLPLNLRAGVQGLLSMNSAGVPQQPLQNAAADFGTRALALTASFQTAGQDLMAGDVQGAANSIEAGFHTTELASGFPTLMAGVTPTGTVGDLLPTLTVAGQVAQSYTNLMPAGSIPTQMTQPGTNLIATATGTGVAGTITPVPGGPAVAPLGFSGVTLNAVIAGTPVSGLLPGLPQCLPAGLAQAIGGPAAPVSLPVPS
jgi:PE family